LSKHDYRWEAAGQASEADLPAPIARLATRDDALIRFLAAADDWRTAGQRLSGAFAEDEAVRLRRGQEE